MAQVQDEYYDEKYSPLKFQKLNNTIINPQQLIYIWKCLNMFSNGIILINSNKQQVFKNKTVKKLIGKSGQQIDFMQYLLRLSLSNQNSRQTQSENNIKTNKKISSSGEQKLNFKSDKDINKEEFFGCFKKINKQKTQVQKRKRQQEKYGSVIYNLYQSQKQGGEDFKPKINKFKRMATAEVILNDKSEKKKVQSPQRKQCQKNDLLKQSNILSNMNYNNKTNNNHYNDNQIENSAHYLQFLNKKISNNEHQNSQIINEKKIIRNNSFHSNPRINHNPLSQLTSSRMLLNNNKSCSKIGFKNDQNANSYINLNLEDLQQNLDKCIIPDSIEKLFQYDDLIVENIIDFLLEYSVYQKQQKFNTDYQLQQFSEKEYMEEEEEEIEEEEKGFSSIIKQQEKLKEMQLQINDQQTQDAESNQVSIESGDELYQKYQSRYQQNELLNEEIKTIEENISTLSPKNFSFSLKKQKNNNLTSYDDTVLKSKSSRLKKSSKQLKKDYFYFINNNQLHVQAKLNKEKDNQQIIELKFSCLVSKENEEKFVLIEISDVSRLKKAVDDDSLKEYKNKMLSSVSHELRTPLNCSIQLLDMLSQSDEISEVVKQVFVNPALYSNQLLLNIINDILDLAQINYGSFKMQFQQFELPKVCQECFNLISLQAMQKNLTLELEIDQLVPEKINSDPSRIRQVLLNLLSNALKFTQKGTISIKVNLIEENLIQIDVQDTGCGIPSSNLDKIIGQFGREQNTQFSRQAESGIKQNQLNTVGAGLGLTIANNLAAGLGDNRQIKVSSVENVGSVFSFCVKNHSLNQIGCTYEEKNIFSKQFMNWECFSQYSQKQVNHRGSEFLIAHNLNSSSQNLYQQKKKNDENQSAGNIKNTDATQTLIQFNNDIMANSFNRQSHYFNLTNQIQSNNDQQQQQSSNNIESDKLTTSQNPYNGSRKVKYQISFNEFNSDQKSFSDFIKYIPIQQGDIDKIQIQLNSFFPTQQQIIGDKGYRIRTNSVLVLPTSINQIDSIKNSNSTIKYSNPQLKTVVSPIEDNFENLNDPYFIEISQSQFEKLAIQTKDQNEKFQKTIDEQPDNFSSPFQQSKQRYSEQQQKLNFNSHQPNTKQGEIEDDSCNIISFCESQNKKMPNEFNFIQQQNKKLGFINQNGRQSIHSLNNVDIMSKMKNSVNEGEEKSIQKISNLFENQQNLIYDNEVIPINQIFPQNQNQTTKILSKIDESLNEIEENIYFQNQISQISIANANAEDDKKFKKASIQLKLPLSPLKNIKKRESKDYQNSNNQVSSKNISNSQSLQNVSSVNKKIEDKTIQSKQQKIQSYNKNRKCKCTNVLIVDDNEFNIYALEIRLKSYGFVCDKATSGIKALEFVTQKYEQTNQKCCNLYQIIFMDIDMPIKNGYETTKDIQAYFKTKNVSNPTPISACSAYVQESEKIQAKKSGMSYYITKPINQQYLEQVIESCLQNNK